MISSINKVAYEIVFLEVEKLYQKEISPTAKSELEDHLKLIESFIESCGWSNAEYIEEFTHRAMREFLPPESINLQKMN